MTITVKFLNNFYLIKINHHCVSLSHWGKCHREQAHMSVCEVKTVTCVTETYLGSTLQILPPCMKNNSNSKQMITSESL